jgi:hypothetical protein
MTAFSLAERIPAAALRPIAGRGRPGLATVQN